MTSAGGSKAMCRKGSKTATFEGAFLVVVQSPSVGVEAKIPGAISVMKDAWSYEVNDVIQSKEHKHNRITE
jgi:hypothetical protein